MRLRQLVLACGFSSFVLSQYASALGLGEVTLKSSLNQPLEAEIKLLDTRDLTADQILIALASPADFERNGVDRLYFYSEFQFDVVLDSPDGPKVLVTSRNPVREPYLNFLVEARWTAGRLLREYTLLMDLPTFDDDAGAAAVSAPKTNTTTSNNYSAPASRSSTSGTSGKSSPAYSASEPSSSSVITGDSYRVQANDTLWDIAKDVGSSSGVSIHQAMMALYEANPDAFINGNINLLRRGQVLRIPEGEVMKSRSRSEAIQQFAAQTQQDSAMGAQLNASRRSDVTQKSSHGVAGSVKLAAPSSGSSAGQGSGSNSGQGSGLETELAATLEELDKSKAENGELSSRVRDLEEQIKTMERLVDVSNEKLRAMQLAAQQQENLSAETVTPASTEAPVSAVETNGAPQEESSVEEPAVVSEEPEVSNTAVVADASSASSAASSSVASVSVAKVVAPAPKPSMTDTLIENSPWIGLGALVLGLGGFFAYRRRKEQNEFEESEYDQETFSMDAPEEEESLFNEEVSEDLDLAEQDFEDDTPVEAETGDVVAEAEIYIAYGQLDKAEELLINGLNKDPDSSDIRLKLLEVYSNQQNLNAFDSHYRLLAPVAGAAILARAAELRATIPGAESEQFELPEDDTTVVLGNRSAPSEFDFAELDLDDDIAAASESVSEEAPASLDLASDELEFDLDLGDDFAVEADAPTEKTTAESLGSIEDDFSLEDLDLDDHDLGAEETLDFSLDDDSEFSSELGDFDLELEEESAPLSEPDDLSELSLALDDLDADKLPDDVSVTPLDTEDEFNFDFDTELTEDQAAAAEDKTADLTAESLEVSADDFNLDMDVADVDLAALDHEMEALDYEIESEDDTDELLDLDKSLGGLESDLDDEPVESIPSSGLVLTDDLDLPEIADLSSDDEFSLDMEDELVPEDSTLEMLGDDADLSLLDEELVEPELEEGGVADEPAAAEEIAEEDMFAAALSDFSGDDTELDIDKFSAESLDASEEDMDAELDFLADADEAATKLDLARAYIDMGDAEGAKDILTEVVGEGNAQQKAEAEELLARIDA